MPESPLFEERRTKFFIVYLTVTTPIVVGVLVVVAILLLTFPMGPSARVWWEIFMLFALGPLGMMAMWHVALTRQPFRVFADRIEPTSRPVRLAFKSERRSIKFSEVSGCEFFDVTDSWGKPAFRKFELTLVSGEEVGVYVPGILGERAGAFIIDTLKSAGVPITIRSLSVSAWDAEKRRRKLERRHDAKR